MRGVCPMLLLALLLPACQRSVVSVNPVGTDEASIQAQAGATSVGGARSAQRLPFRGRFAGTSEIAGVCEGGMLLLDRGTGVATHLGAVSLENSGCYAMTPTSVTSIGTGSGRLVAANGDEVHFTIETASGNPTTGAAQAAMVIRGGTGRFVNATGEFQVATRLLPDLAFTAEIVAGWISF